MWKLTIEDDEGKQTSLPLAHEEYGLGRAEANAIRLTDRNVSRKHAVLKQNGVGWHLKDLASYNGTYVNGVRVVGEQGIHSGDIVQLGDYRLELLDEAAVQPSPEAAAAPVPQATSPVHQRPDRLVVVVGPQPGAEFPLDKDHFTIGRSEEATISINHSSVSRVHAELLSLGGGRYEIVDKASANGIRINGVELRRGILEAGDALELGDVRLRFVGAGKIFRAGADQSQQLAAVSAFESVAPSVRAPAPPASRSGLGVGKLVGIGAGFGVLLIAAFLVVSKSGNGNASPVDSAKPVVQQPVVDDATKILKNAADKVTQKDFDGAHEMVLKIPEESPVRSDPQFKAIESAWADWMFQQVDATSDPAQKRKLLNKIALTPTVDAERRKKAAEMIQAMDAAEVPTADTTQVIPTTGPRPPNTATTAPGTVTSNPGTATTTQPNPVPSTPSDLSPSSEDVRRRLAPKAWNNRASVDELKTLKAACKHLHDDACRDRADGLLRKKLAEGAP